MSFVVESTNAANKVIETWLKDAELVDQLRKMVDHLSSSADVEDLKIITHLKAKNIRCRYEYRKLKNNRRVFYEVIRAEDGNRAILRYADTHLKQNSTYPDLTIEAQIKPLPLRLQLDA
jgi:hypothetical protein